MKKKLLFSVFTVAVVISLMAGATFALFTSEATNTGNSFAAGTVVIGVDNPGTWSAGFDNMAPGDSVSKTITVKNNGTLALKFGTRSTKSGALFGGTTPAKVYLTNGTGTLAAGATQDVTVRVELPLAADNAYQGAAGSLELIFDAVQSKNLVAGTATIEPTTGGDATYDAYYFKDSAGNVIQLTENNIKLFTETRPDGTVAVLRIVGNTDPKYYFNKSKPAGTYSFNVVTADGNDYTGTLVRP